MSTLKNKLVTYRILITAIVVVIIGIVAYYANSSQKNLNKYAQYTVEQNAEEILYEINSYTVSAINSIRLAAEYVSRTMTSESLENADEALMDIIDETPFDYMVFIDKEGYEINGDAEGDYIGNKDYYTNGIEGETGIWIDFYPDNSDEFLLIVYSPIYYEDRIVGVLTGVSGADTNLLPLLSMNFYGEEMIGILLDDKGQIISASDTGIDKETYLDAVLYDYGITNEGIRSFNQHLQERDKSVFEFKGSQGNAIACIITNEETGWKLVEIVPVKSFKSIMRQNTISAYFVVVIIILIIVAFLVYLRVDWGRKQRAIIKKKTIEARDYEQMLTAIASDTYKAIRKIDLDTGNAEYICFENQRIEQKEIGSWTEWLKKQSDTVYEEDFDKVKGFLSIDSLRAMEDGSTQSMNFRASDKNEKGFFRIYTSTISILVLEDRRTALMVTIDNTDAVMGEMEKKRLLDSVASIYVSVHAMDLKNDTLERLNSAAHIDKVVGERSTGVQQVLRDAMSKLAEKDYLDEIIKFTDFSTLDERMKGAHTITLEFVGRKTGWCRARFIAVDYDEDGRLSNVLWLVEDIDAEKRRANKLLYMSETDLMTGICNRGSGEKKIKELLDADCRGMFFLMDVDNFKSINDTFGHKVGDRVLIDIADSLKTTFSDDDVVMRLGGDEFAVFARNLLDVKEADELINKLFERIEAMDIPELGDRKITVSVGCATSDHENAMDFDALYRNADSCTYKSKRVQGSYCTFYDLTQSEKSPASKRSEGGAPSN